MKEKIRSFQGFMCPECYHTENVIYNVEYYNTNDVKIVFDIGTCHNFIVACPKCGDVKMVPIDYGIVNEIAELNKMGYHTKFSCMGHVISYTGDSKILDETSSLPYVVFDTSRMDKQKVDTLINLLTTIDNHRLVFSGGETSFVENLKIQYYKRYGDPQDMHSRPFGNIYELDIRVGISMSQRYVDDLSSWDMYLNHLAPSTFKHLLLVLIEHLRKKESI